jgi:hypothetical protein
MLENMIYLSVASLTSIILLSVLFGLTIGSIIMIKAMRPRKPRLVKADQEIYRLSEFLMKHYPEAIREASVVDVTIELLREQKTKKQHTYT